MLISIGVFLVAVISAFSSQITSMGLMSTSRETTVAVTELRAAMEEILVLQLHRIPVDFPEGQAIARYDDRSLQDQEITVGYPGLTDIDDPPNPLTVALDITWTDHGGRRRSMSLATMKSR